MAGTSEGAKKFAQKKLAEDPDYFKKLQKQVRKPRGGKASPGSFKPGNKFASKGGKTSKRGSLKSSRVYGEVDLGGGVITEFIETEAKDANN